MNPEVEPLLVHLDVLPEHLKAYPFDKYRVIKDFEVCWDANWKTALDAFVEFYHADDVHPEVIPVSETLQCQYDLYGHGLSRLRSAERSVGKEGGSMVRNRMPKDP